jgi:hypothetical protein
MFEPENEYFTRIFLKFEILFLSQSSSYNFSGRIVKEDSEEKRESRKIQIHNFWVPGILERIGFSGQP